MKVLLDMNMSPLWVAFLEEAGLSTAHWSTIGKANETDVQIMRIAAHDGWVILTLDLDFGIMLAQSSAVLPSVVQLRTDDVLPTVIGSQVVSTLQQMQTELERGALVTIDARRTRVRILPLH